MAGSNSVDGQWPPLRMSGIEVATDPDDEIDEKPPVHPVPTMQGAFEESMAESLNESNEPDPSDRYSTADSVSRRKMLLEQAKYERRVAGRWKQKPGEKFHPLWKLVAQISFGMHLLQQKLAKSDEEVIRLLQSHVDDIDVFLERSTEDFDLAQGDINDRVRYLRLPLEHGEVFDGMLNDRSFRIAIVEGNEKIEHIIDRTAVAMTDALKDVQKGLDATRELARYLTRVDKRWDDRTEEHDSVYLAMIGNTEGWTRAFLNLQSKGNTLRKALFRLRGIVAEMQKRAGAASRKNIVPVRSINGRYQVESQASLSRGSTNLAKSPNKPLPEAPEKAAFHAIKSHRSSHSGAGASVQSSRAKASSSSYSGQAVADKRPEHPTRLTSSSSGKRMQRPKSSSSRGAQETAAFIKSDDSIPLTPNSTSSRRESFSERTRSVSRKLSLFKDHREDKAHNSNLTTPGMQVDGPTEDASLSLTPRRLSSRKANAAGILSTPASPMEVIEGPFISGASPRPTPKLGNSLPRRSFNQLKDFLPAQPAISPLIDQSFTFPEGMRSQTHSRSSSHQHYAPGLSRHGTAHTNSASSLSNGVDEIAKHSARLSRPARDLLEINTKVSPNATRIYQGTGSNLAKSNRKYRGDFHQPLKSTLPGSVSGAIASHSHNLHAFQEPSSSVITELEAPLPPSHPLLSESRHPKHTSPKTAPSSPSFPPSRDLPLRHYQSQEAVSASERSLRTDEPPLPGSSSSRRASAQVSPDIVALLSHASLTATLFPAPPQSPATPSTLRLVTDSSHVNPVADQATQLSDSSFTAPPILGSASPAKKEPEPLSGSTPVAAPSFSAVERIESTNTVHVDPNVDPNFNDQNASKSPSQEPSSSLSAPDHSSKIQYNTSATNNVPFFLSSNTSSALLDFLASTPPTTPYEPLTKPGLTKANDAPTSTEEAITSTPVVESLTATAPPPPLGPRQNLTTFKPQHPPSSPTHEPNTSTTPPPSLLPASSAVPKTPKWKKMFGARGAARQKAIRTGPEVVIVDKGEWYKIDRKKKNKNKQPTPNSVALEAKQDINGASGSAGPTNREPTSSIGTGIMGSGKDAVWISGKNFVKS